MNKKIITFSLMFFLITLSVFVLADYLSDIGDDFNSGGLEIDDNGNISWTYDGNLSGSPDFGCWEDISYMWCEGKPDSLGSTGLHSIDLIPSENSWRVHILGLNLTNVISVEVGMNVTGSTNLYCSITQTQFAACVDDNCGDWENYTTGVDGIYANYDASTNTLNCSNQNTNASVESGGANVGDATLDFMIYPNDAHHGYFKLDGISYTDLGVPEPEGEGGKEGEVPEFSDYAIAFLLMTVAGGFIYMRKKEAEE